MNTCETDSHEGSGLLGVIVGMVYGIAVGVGLAFLMGMRFPT